MTLADLALGASAKVAALEVKGANRRRMLDLGLVPGTLVQALFRSPAQDPLAFLVRGSVVAFRLKEARLVILDPGGN